MRPPKIILCVGSDPASLSVLTFLLWTYKYRVIDVSNGTEAVAVFTDGGYVDLVLCAAQLSDVEGDVLVQRLKQLTPHTPMILLDDPQKWGDKIHHADALLNKYTAPVELLQKIKVMSARKRGPREGSHRVNYCAVNEAGETFA